MFKKTDEKYRDYRFENIKPLLIKSYKKLNDYKRGILTKWNSENKEHYAKLVKTKGVSFEAIILGDDYFITTIDIVILMHFYKLPLVLMYQQKNKIKTFAMTNETDYYMYIKVKAKTQFLLHISDSKEGKSLRFYNNDQKDVLLKEISVLTIKDYFEDPIL